MSEISGRWIGRIEGTNSGNVLLELDHKDGALSGHARLNDTTYGLSAFGVTGTVCDGQLTLDLAPREVMPDTVLTRARVCTSIQADGSMRGTWEAEGGTAGTFVAVREQRVQEGLNTFNPQAASATAVRYEKSARVPPCVVDYDTLRRLYREMNTGAAEAFRLAAVPVAGNAQAEQVLRLAHSVTIQARGASGEQIITVDPEVLRQETLPIPLQFVTFELGLYHRIVLNGSEALNRAIVSLDFSKPKAFDLSNPSGAPTPNGSSLMVVGTGSIWVSGVYQKLLSVVEENRTGVGFLHSGYVYDVLLLSLGLPFTLASAAVASQWVSEAFSLRPTVYHAATFVFMLAMALMVFRLAFSLARWLLPYVEFAPQKQPLERRIRTLLAVVTLGILGSLGAWVILKVFNAG